MRILVTGSEGFVGGNLVRALADAGHFVLCSDEKLDNVDMRRDQLVNCDAVCHLAANADVRFGWEQPARDIERNTVATADLLEDMRATGVKRLLFASSSAVYGDAPIPTPETYAGRQTSLYGASKIACEGLIGAYVEAGFLQASVFRLTSMLGPGYRHGLVKDFVEALQQDPNHLEILGDGHTERTRMDVTDGCAAFVQALERWPDWELFNVGTDETVNAYDVAVGVALCMPGINDVTITRTGSSWAGDHPILLDCTKLRETGWEPQFTLHEALIRTVDFLL